MSAIINAPSFLWPDSPLKVGILVMLGLAVALLIARPSIMFDHRHHFKHFGPRRDETLLPFWLAILVAGVSAYYVSLAKG